MVFGFGGGGLFTSGFVKPDHFEVVLEKQQYFAGEFVRGAVHLKTSQPITCRLIQPFIIVLRSQILEVTEVGRQREMER